MLQLLITSFIYPWHRLCVMLREKQVFIGVWRWWSNKVGSKCQYFCWSHNKWIINLLEVTTKCCTLSLTLSPYNKIRCRRFWKHFGRHMKNYCKCKYYYWKDLKTLWQKREIALMTMSNFSFYHNVSISSLRLISTCISFFFVSFSWEMKARIGHRTELCWCFI